MPASSALRSVAPDAAVDLTMVTASFEQLTGEDEPFAFGLVDATNEPLRDAEVDVYVLPPQGDAVGPARAQFRDVEGVPIGLYVAELDFPDAGPTTVAAVLADGARAGETTVQVVTPEGSTTAAPGDEAVSVATPTTDDDLGFERICTLDPSCGMHEVSLDQALGEGRPVVLTFATPAFCQTAVCGPSVEVVDGVRADGDWPDELAWIHVEIYRDAGQTLAEPVEAWGLQSEPWLFALAADGTVAGRADGPLLTLPDQVERVAQQVT